MSDAKTEFEQRVSPQDFNKKAEECLRQKQNAKEYAGMFGQAKKQAQEAQNLNGKAYGWHLGLRGMESTKRRDVVRSFIQYEFMDPNGAFAQLDAFDDMNITLENILDGAVNPPERTSDNVVVLDGLVSNA